MNSKYNISAYDITTDIQNVAKKLNIDNISFSIYKQYGSFSQGPLTRVFGSVTNAIRAAGFNGGTYNIKIYKQKVIDDIKRVFDVLDKPSISLKTYIKHGIYSETPIKRLFQTWENACKNANIPIHKRPTPVWLIKHNKEKRTYSSNELVIYLKQFYKEFGYVPGKRDISQNKNYPNDKAYYRCFKNKSWADILAIANLKSPNQHPGKDGKYYDSIEEMKIANTLFANYIRFDSHKIVTNTRKWTCDFYIHDLDLWIEYDGLQDKRLHQERYQEKLQYYRDHNFNILEIKPGDNIIQKCNLYLPKINPSISKISFKIANDFLARTHYLGNASRGSTHYGAFIQNILVGVISIGRSPNKQEKSLAINRIAWLDRVRNDRNFGSKFVSVVLNKIKKSGYKGQIVSWSDPRLHQGTLYKACNFTAVITKQYTDYIYVDSNGYEYHKSKCRVPAGQSELEYAKSLGLTKIKVPPKQKWVFNIN